MVHFEAAAIANGAVVGADGLDLFADRAAELFQLGCGIMFYSGGVFSYLVCFFLFPFQSLFFSFSVVLHLSLCFAFDLMEANRGV